MNAERDAPTISLAGRLTYALGSIGTGVFSTVPTILLLYFSTEVLAISVTLATIAIFLPKAWTILWDPTVGGWSDRLRPRFGRAPFLLIGAVGVGVSFVALFVPPEGSAVFLFAWVAAAYFMLATTYSLFAVPYIALPAELTDSARERAQLVSARMTLAMVGVLLGAAGAPYLVEMAGGGREGYRGMAVVVALCCLLAMAFPIVMMLRRTHPADAQAGEPGKIGDALEHGRFRTLALAYVLQLTAVGAVSAAAPYLVTRVLGRGEGDIGAAMGVFIVATIITVPLWTWVSLRIGAIRALLASNVFYALASAALAFGLIAGAAWEVSLGLFALLGVPFAGIQVLPFTLLADLIHDEARRTGRAVEGMFTGLWTAAEKLGLALGPAATGASLAFAGGDARALSFTLLWLPALLLLAALALLILGERRQAEPA